MPTAIPKTPASKVKKKTLKDIVAEGYKKITGSLKPTPPAEMPTDEAYAEATATASQKALVEETAKKKKLKKY